MRCENSPASAAISFREGAERLASEVLTRSGIRRAPVDVDAIAAAQGLRYLPISFASVQGAYVGTLGPGAHPRADGRAVAFIGSHQHPLRQRFTRAHELGHHLIDHGRVEWVNRLRLELPCHYQGDVYHEAHEHFAAALLMPRGLVERFAGGSWRRGDVERLARAFGVTKIAAAVRVEELYGRRRGQITPRRVTDLDGLYAQA